MHRHREGEALLAATPAEVFAFVDDHSRFASHMSRASWMMGGGRMLVDVDDANARAVGSHIRLSGTVFGVRLSVDEVVAIRNPPSEKVWETTGSPRLLVIGSYRMGSEIRPATRGSRLRVFIDYELPTGWVTHWLGRLFGGFYAGWCVRQMLAGASGRFSRR